MKNRENRFDFSASNVKDNRQNSCRAQIKIFEFLIMR